MTVYAAKGFGSDTMKFCKKFQWENLLSDFLYFLIYCNIIFTSVNQEAVT